jgi:hypothetical protein
VPAGQVSFSAACKRSHAEKQHQPYVALRRPKKITNFWSAPRALNERGATFYRSKHGDSFRLP